MQISDGALTGGAVFIVGAIIALWRINGDTLAKLGRKVGFEHCKDVQDNQLKINNEYLERITLVETKIDVGFQRIEDKIDRNGKRKRKNGR